MKHRNFGLKRAIGAVLAAVMTMSIMPVEAFASGEGVLYEKKEIQNIAKGVTYEKSSRLYKAGWMDVYVLTMDASSSDVALKTIQSVGSVGIKTTVPKLAEQNNVFAAVNGDFFGSGNPMSSMGQVADDGKMVAAQNYYNGSENKYAGLYIDKEGVPFIDYVKSTMGFYGSGGISLAMGAKNKMTDFSKPVYFDRTTMTSSKQLDATYSTLSKIVVNNKIVTQIAGPKEVVDIPENGYIIVMNKATASANLSKFTVGMSVDFSENESFVFRPSKTIDSIDFGISGGGEILRNGEYVSQGLIIGQNARNPRTMVGINQDKSKVYIVCIDGRKNGIGATHKEAANIMKEYGAYDAIHFDGGGSTTMVVQEEGATSPSVVNVPSEGSLRAVANGIGIEATGESGVASRVKPYVQESDKNYLFQGLGNTINVEVYDGKLKAMNVDKSKLSFSSSIEGKWNDNVFTPSATGKGTITVKYGDLSGTIDVNVLEGVSGIRLTADKYSLNTGETAKLSVKFVNKDGYDVNADVSNINWSVDDTSIGTVADGVFTAKSEGTAKITATTEGVSSSVTIGVGKRYIAVNSFESARKMTMYYYPEDLGITGSSNVVSGIGSDGSSSLKISGTFKANSTTTQSVYASFENKPIVLPDNSTDLIYSYKGDSSGRLLRALVKDNTGKSYNLDLSTAMEDNQWHEGQVAIPNDLTSPVTLDKIYISALNTTSENLTSEVYVDNLRVMAPTNVGSGISGGSVKDYWNCDLDTVTGSDYETVSAFGRTSGGEGTVLSKVLTQMSNGAKAIAFAGNTSISNTTGVPAVVWNNAYATNGTSKFSFMNIATGNGSPAGANPDQYKYMQDFLNNLSKKNVVVLMDKYLWGTGSYNTKERDALHDIFETAAHQYNKNIIVLSSAGESNYTEIKDGVRYINLAGVGGKGTLQYLKLKGNDKDMYYEFVNVN